MARRVIAGWGLSSTIPQSISIKPSTQPHPSAKLMADNQDFQHAMFGFENAFEMGEGVNLLREEPRLRIEISVANLGRFQ
jgi:hypothetical protein